MEILGLLGRLVVAWLFIASGAGNLIRTGRVAAHARARNVPRPRLVTLAAGFAMAGIGLAMALGLWLDLVLGLGAALLAGIAVTMHPFWGAAGLERERMNVQFWKDLALAGALLVWLTYVVETGVVPYGLTDPLF